ncbi:MAG TPA: sensor histidine kinase [Gemmatimonadaceae bacterium]|nr:sensor histidine kinase [Gemmatimonadaceae bacterium]
MRRGHSVRTTAIADAPTVVDAETEAVVIAARRTAALDACTRIKTRFHVPLLPVLVLLPRPLRVPSEATAPDAWLASHSSAREVAARVEELVRIRRVESELVRTTREVAELAAENGRLYEQARRDSATSARLLRELQHRVRNNLAAIQALLVLERGRTPPRPLPEAIDSALTRLRSMAALQDCLQEPTDRLDVAALAASVARGAAEILAPGEPSRLSVTGRGSIPASAGSALALVLNELVTNALRHAAPTPVRIDIEPDRHALTIHVVDEGCGTTSDGAAGTGLLIARAITRNELGGQLERLPSEHGTHMRLRIAPEALHPSGS